MSPSDTVKAWASAYANGDTAKVLSLWKQMDDEDKRLHLITPRDKAPIYWRVEEAVRDLFIWYGWRSVTPGMFNHITDLDTAWAVLGLMERRGQMISYPMGEVEGLPGGLFVMTDEFMALHHEEHVAKAEWRRAYYLTGFPKLRHRISEFLHRLRRCRVRFRSPIFIEEKGLP